MSKQKFIYKLVDKTEIGFANRGLISLSRPMFEFKGSEGKIISFAQRIYERYLKQGLNVQPTETDFYEIKEWNNAYKKTYGKDFVDEDIDSESMILFCGIIQAYCGYFTSVNLFNKRKLKKFLKKNKLTEKTAVIRVDLNAFENNHWNTNDIESSFEPYFGDKNNLRGYNGFTHLIDIVYSKRYKDSSFLLKQYNKEKLRHSSNWFDNLNHTFKWQKEKRIIFLLRNLEKNSSRIRCRNVYKANSQTNSFGECIFRNIVDAIDYSSKSPRYILLNVANKITIKDICEIL